MKACVSKFGGLGLLSLLLLTGKTSADTLTWDANTGSAGAQDGNGNWNTSGANWWDGSGNVQWNSVTPDSAIFGVTAGGVVTNAGVTVSNITFNFTYTILSNTLTLAGTPTITASANSTIASRLGGTGFVKEGAGSLTLNSQGASTYTGPITVNAGTLIVSGNTGDGTIRGDVIVNNSATLQINTGDRIINTSVITLNAGGRLNMNAGDVIGYLSGSGLATNTTGTSRTLTLDMGGGVTNEFSGAIGGAVAFTARGNGVGGGLQILSGSNTYSGATTVNNASLRITHDNALGLTSGITTLAGGVNTGRLELANNITVAEPLTFQMRSGVGSFMPQVLNVEGTNTLTGTFVLTTGGSFWNIESEAGKLIIASPLSSAATSVRTIRMGGASELEARGIISNGSAGTFNLTKVGNGVMSLTTNNTYNGTTTIEAGTLALGADGAIGNSAAIVLAANSTFDVSAVTGGYTLNNNQQLQGFGLVKGAATLAAGARLAPGAPGAAGTLTFSNDVSFAAGATNLFDLSGSTLSGNDKVVVGGNLGADGDIVINLLAPLDTTNPYRLFDYGGTLSGPVNISVPGSRYTATVVTSTVGQVDATFTNPNVTLVWDGVAAAWDIDNTVAWTNSEKFLQADSVVFNDTATNNYAVTLTGTLVPTAVTVDSTNDYSFSGAGRISGTTGIDKDGSGTLTIGTANDFTGDVVVSNGYVKLGNSTALGASNGVTRILSGATLDINGIAHYASRENIVIEGTGVSGTGAVINAGAVQNNAIANLTLAGDASVGAWGNRWDIRGPAGVTSGTLDLNGYTLTKLGAGELSLVDVTATNAGSIDVAEGMLRLARNDMSGAGTINLASNTLLFFQSYTSGSMSKDIVMSNATIQSDTTLTIQSDIALDQDGFFNIANTLTVAGEVSGAGQLTKYGNGTLALMSNNTYSGATVVSGGTLRVAHDGALGGSAAGTSVIGGNGTTGYSLNLASNITIASEPLLLSGSSAGRAYLRNAADTNTWGGPIEASADVSLVGLTADSGLLRITGDISGAATNGAFFAIRGAAQGEILGSLVITGALFKTDDGQWTIGAAGESYDWDSFSLARGAVKLGAADVLPSDVPVYMGEGGNNTAVLELNGFDQTIAGLQTNNAVTGSATVRNTGGVPAILTISNTADFVFNKTITDGGIGSELTLVKEGPGTQTLSGTGTFLGATIVKNGVLLVGGQNALQNSTVSNLVAGGIAFGAGTAYTFGGLAGAVDLTLENASAAALTLTAGGNGADTRYDGVLSGLGGFTKTGNGTLTLGAASTYAGTTTIKQGTILATLDNTLPTGTTLVLGDTASSANSGTLDLAGYNQSVARLQSVTQAGATPGTNYVANLSAGRTLSVADAGTGDVLLTGDSAGLVVSGGGALDVQAPLGNLTIWGRRSSDQTSYNGIDVSTLAAFTSRVSQAIVGYDATGTQASRQGELVLAPTNLLTADNFYLGYSTRDGSVRGRLLLGEDTTIRSTNMVLGFGKGQGFIWAGPGVVSNRLTIAGLSDNPGDPDYRANLMLGKFNQGNSGTQPSGRLFVTNAGETITARLGSMVLGSHEVSAGNATAGGYGYFTFNDGAVDADSIVVARSLAGANTGTAQGFLTMNGGTLDVNKEFVIAQRASTAIVTGRVSLAGGLATVYTNITGGGGVSILSVDGGSLDMQGHEIGTAAEPLTASEFLGGALFNVGGVNGSGTLVKTGPGTLRLEGANTYSGNTVVSNGSLRVNGSYSGGGLISVVSGASLGGTGTVGAVTIEAGGAMVPGNSTGNLTVSGLTLNSGASLVFELGAVGFSDRITDNGTTTFVGLQFADFTFVPVAGFALGTYTLIDSADLGTSSLGATTSGTISYNAVDYTGVLSLDGTGDNVLLTVIPEPGTAGLVGLVLVAALLRRRRA